MLLAVPGDGMINGGARAWSLTLQGVRCRMYSTTNKKWQPDTSVPLRGESWGAECRLSNFANMYQ